MKKKITIFFLILCVFVQLVNGQIQEGKILAPSSHNHELSVYKVVFLPYINSSIDSMGFITFICKTCKNSLWADVSEVNLYIFQNGNIEVLVRDASYSDGKLIITLNKLLDKEVSKKDVVLIVYRKWYFWVDAVYLFSPFF